MFNKSLSTLCLRACAPCKTAYRMARGRVFLSLALLLALSVGAGAQVLSPLEVNQPELRELQQRHFTELRSIGDQLSSHKFSYPFYFSRTLDVDEAQQKQLDQRSIRFDKFGGKTVLEITGNYYAAYSGQAMSKNQRARKTFEDVMLPIFKTTVPVFQSELLVEAFALEVSHHVRKEVMGVIVEKPENLVVVLPRSAALQLVMAKTPLQQQSALLEGSVFIDAEPFSLWLTDDVPAEMKSAANKGALVATNHAPRDPNRAGLSSREWPVPSTNAPLTSTNPFEISAHDASQAELDRLKAWHQPLLDQIVREMDTQAHFVAYAPPSFIPFHHATYLQLSVNTTLAAGGSRYKVAALAFDEHIGGLVRPLLAYLKDDSGADGVTFSTNVRLKTEPGNVPSSTAVEYFLPLSALRCYEKYDCTGQQLLNSGFVLINGERVSLELQTAE